MPKARACLSKRKSGSFVGGLCGAGGKKPNISSKYRMARKLVVPLSERIHDSIFSSSSVIMKARSASFRCAT